MAATFTIYSKEDCYLCDVAKAVLEKAARRYAFDVVEVDICATGNEAHYDAFKDDIPVVTFSGSAGVAFQHRVDRGALEDLLHRAGALFLPDLGDGGLNFSSVQLAGVPLRTGP